MHRKFFIQPFLVPPERVLVLREPLLQPGAASVGTKQLRNGCFCQENNFNRL